MVSNKRKDEHQTGRDYLQRWRIHTTSLCLSVYIHNKFKTPPPNKWPPVFNFPHDIFQAMLYSKFPEKLEVNQVPTLPGRRRYRYCNGLDCPKDGQAATINQDLCDCNTPSWKAFINEESWLNMVELRFIGPEIGIGAFSKISVRKNEVLGEYFGEVISGSGANSKYVTGFIWDDDDETEAALPICIHAVRVGCWTRFMNHSCQPNCGMGWRRVGKAAYMSVWAFKDLPPGTQLTLDYGPGYWKHPVRDGKYCQCGFSGCLYGDPGDRFATGGEQRRLN